MEQKKPEAIACMPVALANPSLLVPGSEVRKCAFCQRDIFVSPSSIALQLKWKVLCVCIACACAHGQADEPVEVMPPQPEQMPELRQKLNDLLREDKET